MNDLLSINKRWAETLIVFNQVMAEWAIENPRPSHQYGEDREAYRLRFRDWCSRKNEMRAIASQSSGCDRMAAEYKAATV